MTDARDALAALEGVATEYRDQTGRHRTASPETLGSVLEALGHDPGPDGGYSAALAAESARRAGRELPDWLVVAEGSAPALAVAGNWRLALEDGAETEGRGALPALPPGRHRLEVQDETCWLLSAPPALPLPERGWGVVLPLYGLRDAAAGGIGDYHDLADAVRALGALGAGFVGINPIHAGLPTDPDAISPYSPSHRRRFAVMHLHAEGEQAAPGGPLVDYLAGKAARMAALERAFAGAADDPAFAAFLAREGAALTRFATYEALAEVYGPTWDRWPAALRHTGAPEVARFAAGNERKIKFHSWLQYTAEKQLSGVALAAREIGMAQGIYLDLAVGTHPNGAETWCDPEPFAVDVSLGAPPDAFSETGQVWHVAPFNPRALAAEGFAALAATLRAQLRFAGMLRIDHILGFERAFWVPDGGTGTYVRMPREAMLAVVRIEAARAGAVIVGEDLGNIPKGLQDALHASGILGYRVAMFEHGRQAEQYPEAVLTSFGTHDLPTWKGWREGRDIAERRAIGGMDAADDAWLSEERAAEVARFDAVLGESPEHPDSLHAFLGATPSRLVALPIEDILGVTDQPNLPGTVAEYPNWRRRLPVGVQDFAEEPRIARAAGIMAAAGRAGTRRAGDV